jgi:glycosyltransferase involved in cell wall biosynthesis
MGGQSLRTVRIIARLNVGGPARHTVILDAGLRERGVETLLVHGAVAPDEASMERLADERGVPRHYIPTLGRRIRLADDLRTFWELWRVLRRRRPDVVHTHTAKAGALGRMAATLVNLTLPRAQRAVIVHTFHGHVLDGYFGPVGNRVVRAAEWALARLADRVIAISPNQRADLVERFGVVPADRVRLVPLGLDLEPFFSTSSGPSAVRAALGAHRDDCIVGFVGRFAPIKDVPLLIRAFARFRERVPVARLVLVGDGATRAAAEELAGQLGLDRRVHFLGWRDDLVAVYGAMDLFALTSRNEGTPVSLIEAMAAGVPVVATKVGGVRDVVTDGRTGRLVPPGDEDALAAALTAAALGRDESRAMAAVARDEVRRRYRPERLVNDILALYEEALGPARGASVRSAAPRRRRVG